MTTILDCGHAPTEGQGAHFNGIAHYYDGDGVNRSCCYACAADRLRKKMNFSGLTSELYLSNNEVTDWTGLLRFRVIESRIGRHNFTGKRYDVWFTDHEGRRWWGVTYGDNTEVCHCQRLKGRTG